MHIIVRQFLRGVTGDMWNAKLLSVATDGAGNMKDKVSGEVTRIERESLPGFFGIWCVAHQLDFIVQEITAKC